MSERKKQTKKQTNKQSFIGNTKHTPKKHTNKPRTADLPGNGMQQQTSKHTNKQANKHTNKNNKHPY